MPEPHEHDLVMVSCVADGPGTSRVRARCTVCEQVWDFNGCVLTGIDYGEPTEGVIVEDCTFEVIDDQ